MLALEASPVDAAQAKHFRFAVTWSSLTANLVPFEIDDLAEAASSPIEAAINVESTVLSPTVPVIQHQQAESAASARWEMVVPKMVRPSQKPEVTVRSRPLAQVAPLNGDAQRAAFTGHDADSKPLISRALAAIGRGARTWRTSPAEARDANGSTNGKASQLLQLNAPAPTPEPTKNRTAAIESSLSRIINALNRRSGKAGSLGIL